MSAIDEPTDDLDEMLRYAHSHLMEYGTREGHDENMRIWSRAKADLAQIRREREDYALMLRWAMQKAALNEPWMDICIGRGEIVLLLRSDAVEVETTHHYGLPILTDEARAALKKELET